MSDPTGQSAGKTPSLSARLSENDNQVAGYKRANYTHQAAGHSVVISKEQLTAFERWELASFDPIPGGKLQGNTQNAAKLTTVGELESMRQQAHNEGHEEGYAAGIQQARSEVLQIHALLQNLHGALHKLDEQVAQSLLDLSLEVARKMVSEVLLVRPEIILNIVSEAVSSLPHFNQNAHLVLHPDDADLVRKQLGDQLTHTGWKIFTDAQIKRGGCRVETAHSHIDATTEARWKNVVESIGQDKSWLA